MSDLKNIFDLIYFNKKKTLNRKIKGENKNKNKISIEK
jgi:hypothetical protein